MLQRIVWTIYSSLLTGISGGFSSASIAAASARASASEWSQIMKLDQQYLCQVI